MNNIFTTCDMHGTRVLETVEHQPGQFYTREAAYLPHVPPTVEELAASKAMDDAYENSMRAYDGPAFSDEPITFDLYRTEAAAKRIAELHAWFSTVDDDMHAFNAPSECYSLATRRESREFDAIEAEFGIRQSNPYAERGLEDRTRPVGELLGFGRMVDDYDVLAALGERPALG